VPSRATLISWFGQRVTPGRPQRAGQDERQPEQQHAVDICQVVRGHDHEHDHGDDQEGVAEPQTTKIAIQ
jgi:hypothetical protein